jgi:hypothetical protein
LSRVFEMGTLPNFLREADALLADPDFCRWLASVKADAFDEGIKASVDFLDDPDWADSPVNPYRGAADE